MAAWRQVIALPLVVLAIAAGVAFVWYAAPSLLLLFAGILFASLIDACVRLLPGVMGKAESAAEESFSVPLLEYPQYTRPQLFEGQAIPDILISGDHAKVAAWLKAESEALTRARRPDLWAQAGNPGGRTKSKTDG